jgi:hypothetical protein
MTTEARITPKQEKAIIALLSEPTLKAAAEKAGITEKTLWGWQKEDAFKAVYMQARRLAVQQATARLQTVTGEAVGVLREVMNDKAAKESERVSAAKAVIELAYRGIDLEDFGKRLEVIETALKERKK